MYAVGAAPCLPGMRAWPALPAAIARARVPRAPGGVAWRRSARRGRRRPRVEVGDAARASTVAHGGGVAGEDLGPQVGVAGRDPGDVAQPLAGQGRPPASSRPSSRAATRLAASCGTCETAATAASWRSGSSVLTAAPAERATAGDERDDRRVGLVGGGEHPGPAVEQVVPPRRRRRSARDRPSGASRSSGSGRRRRPRSASSTAPLTEATSVTAASGQRAQRGGHARRGDVRRGGDDDEVGLDRAVGQPPGAEVAGQGAWVGLMSSRVTSSPEAAQRQPQARADAARCRRRGPRVTAPAAA